MPGEGFLCSLGMTAKLGRLFDKYKKEKYTENIVKSVDISGALCYTVCGEDWTFRLPNT